MTNRRCRSVIGGALLCAVAVIPAPAPAQEVVWTNQFGSSSSDTADAIAFEGSSVYVAGGTNGTLGNLPNKGYIDAFVRKIYIDGQEIWTHQFGTDAVDRALGAAGDGEGGVYVAGYTDGNLSGFDLPGSDAFLRRYGFGSVVAWTIQFGTALNDIANDVAVGAGGVYVVGRSGSFAFLRRYDANGNFVWKQEFSVGLSTAIADVTVVGSAIYVAGNTLGGDVAGVFVRRYDPSGALVWQSTFGTPGGTYAYGVASDGAGAVYVAGSTFYALPGQGTPAGFDAFVRRYDANGIEGWTHQFGSPGNDEAQSVVADGGGGAYVAGYVGAALPGQASSGGYDGFVRAYSGGGGERWTRQFGSANNDHPLAVDRGVGEGSVGAYVAGWTGGSLPGNVSSGAEDAFATRVSPTCWETGNPHGNESGHVSGLVHGLEGVPLLPIHGLNCEVVVPSGL